MEEKKGGNLSPREEKKNCRRWATVRRRTIVPEVAGSGARWSGLMAVVEGQWVKWEDKKNGG